MAGQLWFLGWPFEDFVVRFFFIFNKNQKNQKSWFIWFLLLILIMILINDFNRLIKIVRTLIPVREKVSEKCGLGQSFPHRKPVPSLTDLVWDKAALDTHGGSGHERCPERCVAQWVRIPETGSSSFERPVCAAWSFRAWLLLWSRVCVCASWEIPRKRWRCVTELAKQANPCIPQPLDQLQAH